MPDDPRGVETPDFDDADLAAADRALDRVAVEDRRDREDRATAGRYLGARLIRRPADGADR